MTDRLTDADLDAIEQRFAEGRVVNIAAQHQLLAEVRRLRAELTEERLRVRALQASEADHARDRDTIERIIAALDGEQ